MQKFRYQHHAIDLLFTIGLFCVFAISALAVTLAGAEVYKKTTDKASSEYQTYTAFSYLEEKIRQYDYAGGISVSQIDGSPMLCLHETIQDVPYTTYIYTEGGFLKELFLKDTQNPEDFEGTSLLSSGTLAINEKGANLLELAFVDKSSSPDTLLVHLHAEGGGKS